MKNESDEKLYKLITNLEMIKSNWTKESMIQYDIREAIRILSNLKSTEREKIIKSLKSSQFMSEQCHQDYKSGAYWVSEEFEKMILDRGVKDDQRTN